MVYIYPDEIHDLSEFCRCCGALLTVRRGNFCPECAADIYGVIFENSEVDKNA